ncbi:hypothetical protein NUW58_g8345 [Xylaria curta]|uniref:Uncharacterized protein n=1 Tax=Xylaria curta TaxID=42375 RepID=A0ACC1N885_9PEZI|nr:hypothetical protein NUW58_g8345 [Xylaria curta]
MRGTADLIMSGKPTYDLRYEVACPGGSTIQGLRTLEEARTRAVWMDVMRASTSEQSGLGDGLKVQRKSEPTVSPYWSVSPLKTESPL